MKLSASIYHLIRIPIILLIHQVCSLSVCAQGLQSEWFSFVRGPHSEEKPLIIPDNNGNLFVIGIISLYDAITNEEDGSIDSIKIKRYNQLNSTAYLSKLDKNGKVIFNKILVKEGYAQARDIALDNEGNVYILFYFHGAMKFGEVEVYSFQYPNNYLEPPSVVLAKYSADGQFLWHRKMDSQSGINASKIRVDNQNNVVILGYLYFNFTELKLRIDNEIIISFEQPNAFLLSFNEEGTINWVREIFYNHPNPTLPQSQPQYNLNAEDFGFDKDGAVYVSGYYEQGLYFSENDSLYSTSTSIYLVKFSPEGLVQWVRNVTHPTNGGLTLNHLFIHSESIILIVRNFSAGIPFQLNSSTISEYTFEVKYKLDGDFLAAFDLYAANSVITDVAIDKEGYIYLLGGLTPNTSFNYQDINFTSSKNNFLLIKFKEDKILWVQFPGDLGMGLDLEIDEAGEIYWTGVWGCTTNIFDQVLVAGGCARFRSDAVISKISSKSIYFETDKACINNSSTFRFNFKDYTYPSTLQNFLATVEGKNYSDLNFTHTFSDIENIIIQISMTDNIGRSYYRSIDLKLESKKPEISYTGDLIQVDLTQEVESYDWYKDNVEIERTSNPYFSIIESGVYFVKVNMSNLCVFSSSEITVTGITSKKDDVKIWPNPVKDFFYIKVCGQYEASLFSLDGSLSIPIKRSSEEFNEIDIANLPRGLYFIKVVGDNYNYIEKLIKL